MKEQLGIAEKRNGKKNLKSLKTKGQWAPVSATHLDGHSNKTIAGHVQPWQGMIHNCRSVPQSSCRHEGKEKV